MRIICLVSCASHKLASSAPASDLYTSPLFQKSRAVAEKYFDDWFILSAKHGLVRPEIVLEPYNVTLNALSKKDKIIWAERTLEQLMIILNPGDCVVFFAGKNYRDPLATYLQHHNVTSFTPMEGLSIGQQLSWLNLVLSSEERIRHLNRFYELLERLRNGLGGYRILKECNGLMEWPQRGVYFFFDKNEKRSLRPDQNRVVRVGTHAVSKESKSTLWGRLKTHKGTSDGHGNHRSSIFRLHVGQSILKKSPDTLQVPSWGKGDSYETSYIKQQELQLESLVSNYVGDMMLLWINVPDEPGVTSDRSYIEMNSIALVSGKSGPIDISRPDWLGRFRDHEAILHSSLWNVNYVYNSYDLKFLDVLSQYVEITLNKLPLPNSSLAPLNWIDIIRSREIPSHQKTLFGLEDYG